MYIRSKYYKKSANVLIKYSPTSNRARVFSCRYMESNVRKGASLSIAVTVIFNLTVMTCH